MNSKQPSSWMSKPFQLVLFLLITVTAVWFDQFTKRWALRNLGDHSPVPLIEGVLEFLRIENRGAAFGILQGQMSFFYIISAVVGAVILYVLFRLPCDRRYLPLLAAISFIAAGAAGNLIDRTFRKSVVDFIYFKPIDFPVFNVADIYVTVGTAVMMLLVLFYYKDEDFDFLKRGRKE